MKIIFLKLGHFQLKFKMLFSMLNFENLFFKLEPKKPFLFQFSFVLFCHFWFFIGCYFHFTFKSSHYLHFLSVSISLCLFLFCKQHLFYYILLESTRRPLVSHFYISTFSLLLKPNMALERAK